MQGCVITILPMSGMFAAWMLSKFYILGAVCRFVVSPVCVLCPTFKNV
jgi:hypothetical protein